MVSTNWPRSSTASATLLDLEQLSMIASKFDCGAATGLLLTQIPDAKTENHETITTNLIKHIFDYLVSAVIGTDPVVLQMLTEYGERVPASLKVLNESDDHPASTSASLTTLLSLLKNSLKADIISDISTAVVRNHNLKFILHNPSENSRHESIICTNIRKHDNHYKNSLPASNHCKDKLSKN